MADTKGKSRVTNWTTSQNKVFLNLLLDQYHKNMCNQGTFKQHIWNDIVGPFNAHTKKEANTNNLMNRWKNMKKQYRLLEQLLSRTGWSWNYVTKMPVPTEESAWAEAIAVTMAKLLLRMDEESNGHI